MIRPEKRLNATKSYVFLFYTPSQTFLNDFACRKKSFWDFQNTFIIRLVLIRSYDRLHLSRFQEHFSKNSKYVPTEQHWASNTLFKILCSCGLGKKSVSNTYHLPKILIFWQLPLKHFFRHPYHDTNDYFCHTSRVTFSLPLQGFHLHLKQWIFSYLLTCSQHYF